MSSKKATRKSTGRSKTSSGSDKPAKKAIFEDSILESSSAGRFEEDFLLQCHLYGLSAVPAVVLHPSSKLAAKPNITLPKFLVGHDKYGNRHPGKSATGPGHIPTPGEDALVSEVSMPLHPPPPLPLQPSASTMQVKKGGRSPNVLRREKSDAHVKQANKSLKEKASKESMSVAERRRRKTILETLEQNQIKSDDGDDDRSSALDSEHAEEAIIPAPPPPPPPPQPHKTAHHILVDFADVSDPGSLTELYIRGWEVNITMMNILNDCLPNQRQLKVLHLWNVGLEAVTLDILAKFAPACPNLTVMFLDNNPWLRNAPVSSLLKGESRLQELSLRFCELNDMNAHAIGHQLGNLKTWNSSLRQLNMANNKIGDNGARFLAEGLKTNRELLVLNLAGNKISDVGAAALADALGNYKLNKEQLFERRQAFSKHIAQFREREQFAAMGAVGKRGSSNIKKRGPGKAIQNVHVPKKKDGQTKKKAKAVAAEKSQIESYDTMDWGDMESDSPSPKRLSQVSHAIALTISSTGSSHGKLLGDLQPCTHPLCEGGATDEDGDLRIVGNRSLISLNLTRNNISDRGLRKLIEMLRLQSTLVPCQVQTSKGLYRLVVIKNPVKDLIMLKQFEHLMTVRDPLHRTVTLCAKKSLVVNPCCLPMVPC